MSKSISCLLMLSATVGLHQNCSAGILQAVRASSAPIIDGKLADDCWQASKPVTGFKRYNSQVLAHFQTTGHVLYDDVNLYLGARCEEPNPSNLRSKKRPHDANVFADDVVEIMLDPGASGRSYFQFAINASGATFDCSRAFGGASEDDEWNGDVTAATFVGEDYWSLEVAIPYHSLGITSRVGTTWGINLCREKPNPSELSTIAADGVFNNAKTFAKLEGLKVDFRPYSVLIGPTQVQASFGASGLITEVSVPVRNDTGRGRPLTIERRVADASGNVTSRTESLSLKSSEEKQLPLEALTLMPSVQGGSGSYILSAFPATKRLTIAEAETGRVLKTCNLQYPKRLKVLGVRVLPAGVGRQSSPPGKEGALGLELTAALSDRSLKAGSSIFEVTKPDLRVEGSGVVLDRRQSSRMRGHEVITFAPRQFPTGRLRARYALYGPKRELLAETHCDFVNPGEFSRTIHPLNNLVSELLSVKEVAAGSRHRFVNPRDGWVFVSTSRSHASGDRDRLQAVLERGNVGDVLTSNDSPAATTQEAMRWLPAGEYAIAVEGEGSLTLKRLIVRAIPELIYCKFPNNPQVTGHGAFDWTFLKKHLLPNVNCIVGNGDPQHQSHVKQWKSEGKKWIVECPLPGIATDTITAEEAFNTWAANPGYADPLLDGVIVDEFTGGDLHKYEAWAEGLRRLLAQDSFGGKSFYPYCGSIYGADATRTFMETVMASGSRFAWEQYLQEQPTEQAARRFLESTLKQGMMGWRNALPGSASHAIVCFGYLCAPPESCNTDPAVDYKVWMDMQYNLLANAPAFKDLYGVMEYTSSYADEEALRWQGRLYRHYCIEGKKTMLSRKLGFRYQLTHVTNPDFNEGTRGWAVSPAEAGSLSTHHLDGLGWLEGRYPRTGEGDNFLTMQRSARKPNTVSQEIRDLKPGRLYSLKMFTSDYGDLTAGRSVCQQHAVRIGIEGGELISANCFQEVMPHCYAHDLGPFNINNRAWLNYHWKVFRAQGKTARLTISDWLHENEPGGPAGQQLMLNFVEVQPYLGE